MNRDRAIDGTTRGSTRGWLRLVPLIVAIAAVVRSYRRLTVTEQEVAGQRIPLLAVIGSEDTANMRDVDVLKRIRPDLQLVVIDGATHNEPRNARARSELTDAVRRFVAEHSLAAGRPAR